MTRLTRSWLAMSTLAVTVAATMLFFPSMPRYAWLGLIFGASLAKARLILLDYLELRGTIVWRQGAIAALVILLLPLCLLAAI